MIGLGSDKNKVYASSATYDLGASLCKRGAVGNEIQTKQSDPDKNQSSERADTKCMHAKALQCQVTTLSL